MSDAVAVMFGPEGRPTPVMIARWRGKGAIVAMPPRTVLIERDRTATPAFRSFWKTAFPDKESLPPEPISDREGRFTQKMLSIWT